MSDLAFRVDTIILKVCLGTILGFIVYLKDSVMIMSVVLNWNGTFPA